ncbi:aspartic proteinase CDR1-like [Gossypium australe]|uniref:Aspartic proteinase CDR1-like n=1 Tax=Gossypium australe TaxID=47621 RepID=A0A5B6WZT9_9ROSI|nr:aspartic proteinase CDR1-like [Gossypium australe]
MRNALMHRLTSSKHHNAFPQRRRQVEPFEHLPLVSEGMSCFTFSSFQGLAIYGNLAQMNFLVSYDIENQVVSFKPTQCS